MWTTTWHLHNMTTHELTEKHNWSTFFTLPLAKRRLKAGNDTKDKACRRARQINNTPQLKGVLDKPDLPWL